MKTNLRKSCVICGRIYIGAGVTDDGYDSSFYNSFARTQELLKIKMRFYVTIKSYENCCHIRHPSSFFEVLC